ncbi:poly-beta-1,6-N-acetyl-D-glucosamine N-deacetylase PgaB, partial [Acinetobacter baumannii]|uniref:poly-beta-1,6-N-acetyl-D-glucosamine N-deacetylase PgaB n=1 Tax=Acinetobacter baumannii TaxID=470 RepID=UPI002DD43F71
AMPLMESVPIDASQAWLTRLVQAVARHPGALKKTIFELQARDWNRRQQNAIPDQQLADWMRLLRLNGVKNYGYYPDDFINNQPDISRIRPRRSAAIRHLYFPISRRARYPSFLQEQRH